MPYVQVFQAGFEMAW